ncbi:lef-2 [Clostera anastomosis granulovirus B]|uniref:Lef-2 n=1 Tax=Clostera anastomosis granulovirus B TaxID=1986290 RepID=A0A0K0WSD8_9BBAC|nr:lef-2 [Clostera anastomosis granulovirus B]AKS25372.1 lef-2 [Clostera anastomosis granulovirus B]
METFNPRVPIDETKTYKVDKFLMLFKDIGGEHTFLPGGRFFVLHGKHLKLLVKKSASIEYDEDDDIVNENYNNTDFVKSKKKRDVCFLSTMTTRDTVIAHYKKIFFSRNKSSKSFEAFNNLCIKVRNQRYNNRLTFNYLVVKQIQCNRCQNKCVYEALKKFYNMESKCVDQLNRLIAQEYERRV